MNRFEFLKYPFKPTPEIEKKKLPLRYVQLWIYC